MNAFLLAAGRGTRICKDIPEIPKCTLDIGGEPLIIHTVQLLQKNGIDVTVITGYKHTYLENVLKDYSVRIVYNPFYDVTNSIGSLWMAESLLKRTERQIIANADVYWGQSILNTLLSATEEAVMLSDRCRAENGDYFFRTENGLIRDYGKNLVRCDRDCEYVGIASIKGDMVHDFISSLDRLVEAQRHDLWWEDALYAISGEKPVYALDVNGAFWAEVDTISDYRRILDYIGRNKDKTI